MTHLQGARYVLVSTTTLIFCSRKIAANQQRADRKKTFVVLRDDDAENKNLGMVVPKNDYLP